jgi:hypothetical protein
MDAIQDSFEDRGLIGIRGFLVGRGWSLRQSVRGRQPDKRADEEEGNHSVGQTIGHIAVLLRCGQRKIKRTAMNFAMIIRLVAIVLCFCSLLAAQAPPLAVVEQALPPLDAGVEFHILLHATGGVPPYVWSVASGDLPEGITLSPEGLLAGRPSKRGSSALTLKVEDSGQPAHSINKELQVVVSTSLLLEWLELPKVHDNRIDGALQVANESRDTFDLTIIIVAVADNGRATAIGYEHFPLKAGATSPKIPFGNTLPHGGYVIHADAIAEIPARKAILRQRLQTPQPLQVTQGP